MLSKIIDRLPDPEPSCRMCSSGVVTHTPPCPSCREAERERAVERAKRAYVNGDISIGEFEDRVAEALESDPTPDVPILGGCRMFR